MATIAEVRRIDALLESVFSKRRRRQELSKALPHITDVKFLKDQQVGAGTRFRETRQMKGREASTVFEVREYVENEHVRSTISAGANRRIPRSAHSHRCSAPRGRVRTQDESLAQAKYVRPPR